MTKSHDDEANLSRSSASMRKDGASRRKLLLGGSALVAASAVAALSQTAPAQAQQQTAAPPPGGKPNILFIMGDDIGWFNVSAYNMGIMGYRTPNIDRIGREGAVFTDWYGQQSCTAGRAADAHNLESDCGID